MNRLIEKNKELTDRCKHIYIYKLNKWKNWHCKLIGKVWSIKYLYKWFWELTFHRKKKIETIAIPHTIHNIKLRWVKDLDTKQKNLNLLEKKWNKIFLSLQARKGVLSKTTDLPPSPQKNQHMKQSCFVHS